MPLGNEGSVSVAEVVEDIALTPMALTHVISCLPRPCRVMPGLSRV